MIEIIDIRELRPKKCALCGEERAHLRVKLTSVNKDVFQTVIGPQCRLHMEAGLRAQRKWEIRGGKAK